jgi:ribosomal protein S18 acetylase RimI-like enzyme
MFRSSAQVRDGDTRNDDTSEHGAGFCQPAINGDQAHAHYTERMLDTRIATTSDAAIISAHRRAMFEAIGETEASVLDVMCRRSEPWVARMIEEGKYVGWIIKDRDHPVASAGLLILDWPPHPLDPTGEYRAYLLNVFVEPDYRKRGLARHLVQQCMAEAARRRIRVVTLHASAAGRPLYETLGFRTTIEMLYAQPARDGSTP